MLSMRDDYTVGCRPSMLDKPKTKIVCTLGPAVSTDERVEALVRCGMSVARLNLSHGTLEDHREAADRVRRVSQRLGTPVGLMVDVPGAKYRIGPLGAGVLELQPGASIVLTSRDVVGTEDVVSVSPSGIHRDAMVGRPVLLDDGLIELKVTTVQGQDVVCEVVRGGRLTERRGVATPGKAPSQPFPDEKGTRALEFAAEVDADYVALSTVTSAGDVETARSVLLRLGMEPYIISKIERAEAIDSFDSILQVSDAIMVARGDMGVEVPLAKVPIIQKSLIDSCNHVGKPVITATQMLESMIRSSVPTRAEVTDVANAIYDGTDAVMLSGETSIGQYPEEAVKVMAEVAVEAEAALPYESILEENLRHLQPEVDDAISYDACRTAYQLNANLIVAFTESGSTAGRVSKYRPITPVLALTPNPKVQRRLMLRWGVTPVTTSSIDDVNDFFSRGEEMAYRVAGLEEGSIVVLVAGLPIAVPGKTNLLRILTLSPQAAPAQ